MEYHTFLFPLAVMITALSCRLPFKNFPLDDDFSIYTYRVRFAKLGFKWKEDIQLIGNPFWKMCILDFLYSNPDGGVRRLRRLQTTFHLISSITIYYVTWSFTQNSNAALLAGLLYAFYGTSPDIVAGSFNFEQFYIPFVLAGLAFIESRPESIFFAGICFGLASVAKITTLIYVPVMLLPVSIIYGPQAALALLMGVAIPALVSFLTDWKLGYMDATSRKQNKTRLATTLRLVKTKGMYFSILREVFMITKQTLPVWVAGVPTLILTIFSNNHPFLLAFTVATITMMIVQRTFSRYHYLPWIALLSIISGIGLDLAINSSLITWLWGSLFIFSLAWNLESLAPYYFLPLQPSTLARYEKFDQYLYLPYLSKQLKRLVRLKRQSDHRIYVWGTFSQIYHLTNLPASDNYLHYSIGPWDSQSLEGFFNSIIGGLLKYRPVYLIKSFQDLDMNILEQITGLRYRLIKVVLARFPVYKLEAVTSTPDNPMSLPFLEKMNLMKSLTGEQRHAPGINRDDFLQGRINIAFAQCKKLLKLNPKDADGWDYMGEIYASLGKANEAASCYQNVLKIAPYLPENRLWLAIQYIKLNKLDEAKVIIKEEIKKFKYNSEAFYLLAKVYIEQNNFQEATNALDRVRARFPEKIDCWNWSIDALGKLKDIPRLKILYKDTGTIESIGDREWVRTRLAKELAHLNNHQRPEHETINDFLKKEPGNSLLQYALASEFERAGLLKSAIENFKQVASNKNNYPHVQANALFRLARLTLDHEKEKFLKNCLDLAPDHIGAKKLLLETKTTNPSDAELI
jgi:tetratricopeptide (TPR) repeat protein